MTGSGTPIDEIVILAVPRSGTNFFCECLNSLPEVRGYYEVFNPRGVFGVGARALPSLSTRLGLPAVEDSQDPRLISAFREHPVDALQALAEVSRESGANVMSYKIFPRQVPRRELRRILADDRRHVVFVTRRRLDTYVSLQKARLTDSWVNKRTTDLLPSVDIDDFLAWGRDTDVWYRESLDLALGLGRDVLVAKYEQDIDLPRHQVIERASRALNGLGLVTTVPTGLGSARFKRQDKRIGPFGKIANGRELRSALRAAGKLKYALGRPLGAVAGDFAFAP